MCDVFGVFREWDPADKRPPFPYNEKQCLAVKRHVPPEPFGHGYRRGTGPTEGDRYDIVKYSQSEWVLQHPIMETPPHEDQTIHKLHIIEGIACEENRGAQLVRCRLDQKRGGRILVAKIYDALYYSPRIRGFVVPVDMTWNADHDYTREAAAYEEFQRAGVDGKFAPKYYGSWTFDTMLNGVARPVRLILLEWVNGESMDSLLVNRKAGSICPKLRLEILARALEIECTIPCHNVIQMDFAPRNVMLVGLNTRRQTVDRVLMIDFNESYVSSRKTYEYSHDAPRLPACPRYEHWDHLPLDFEAWIPLPHRREIDVYNGWLKSRWEDTTGYSSPGWWTRRSKDFDAPVKLVEPEEDPKDFFDRLEIVYD